MRRIALLSLAALVGCLKPHNVVLAPMPRMAFDVDFRDTVFVTRSDAYTVMAYRRADLPNKAVLDSAVLAYAQLRGEQPLDVSVIVGLDKSSAGHQPIALDTVEVAVYGAGAGSTSPAQVTSSLFVAWDHAAAESARGPEHR